MISGTISVRLSAMCSRRISARLSAMFLVRFCFVYSEVRLSEIFSAKFFSHVFQLSFRQGFQRRPLRGYKRGSQRVFPGGVGSRDNPICTCSIRCRWKAIYLIGTRLLVYREPNIVDCRKPEGREGNMHSIETLYFLLFCCSVVS